MLRRMSVGQWIKVVVSVILIAAAIVIVNIVEHHFGLHPNGVK